MLPLEKTKIKIMSICLVRLIPKYTSSPNLPTGGTPIGLYQSVAMALVNVVNMVGVPESIEAKNAIEFVRMSSRELLLSLDLLSCFPGRSLNIDSK